MSQARTDVGRATERRIQTSGGEVRLRTVGRGPPVLCLHGLSAHGGVWDAVAPRLADRFTLYLPDLPGRGGSEPRPDLSHGLEEEAGRVRDLLSAIGIAPVVTVGHSQGAALALALATEDGTGAGLVLVCPVTPWTRRPDVLGLLRSATIRRCAGPLLARLRRPMVRWILRTRVYGEPGRADAEAVERYAAPYADTRKVRALLRSLADWRPKELEDRLPARPPPARVLAGGRDRRIPPRDARRLAEALHAGLEVIADAGHLLPEEAPAAVARAVDGVYAEVSGAD